MKLHHNRSEVSGFGTLHSWQTKLFSIALTVALFVAIAAVTSAQTESYNFISKWGTQGIREGQFDHPYDIVLDSSESVLYITDTYNHRVEVFTTDGRYLSTWGSYGTENGQFNYSMGLAIDTADNIYVADTCNNRIQTFTKDGRFLSKFGSKGSGEGQFLWPYDVEVDTAGNIYVTDAGNCRIQKFTNEANSFVVGALRAQGKDSYCIHTESTWICKAMFTSATTSTTV